MFRFYYMWLLGAAIVASGHAKGESISIDPAPSTKAAHFSTTLPLSVESESDFEPDSLPRKDDDGEDEPEQQKVQQKTGTVKKDTFGSLRPTHPPPRAVENALSGHVPFLENTGQAVDVAAIASNTMKNGMLTQTVKPRAYLSQRAPSRFSSTASTNPANRHSEGIKNRSATLASEDEKLRLTSRKLVKWLRNRLRKRLEDVERLEKKCEVGRKLMKRLNETIQAEAEERQAEIKMKRGTQDALNDMRRHFAEPDRDLRHVRAENSNLVDRLSHLKRKYNDLVVSRKEMENKLLSAGLTYWLDKRGKEYMPATAAGVLSKSARILDPVSWGLEEVVKLDERFSNNIERMIPISKRSIISKIARDLALLLPVIPVIMLCLRIRFMSRRLSVLHLIMYISSIFSIESGIIFALSLCTGFEVIKELQKSYELFVVTGVFVNVLLFILMTFMQMLVTVLQRSKSEVVQTLLCLAVGYHFFRTIFQPVVVSQLPTATTAAHSMYSISFMLIALEKKAILQVGTRFDNQLNICLLAIERWLCETLQAMNDLFAEALPDKNGDDTISLDAQSLSNKNEKLKEVELLEHPASLRKEADMEEVSKVLNSGRGYARWTAGRTGQRISQGKAAFRGMRWYQTNPQSIMLQSGSRRRAGQEHKS